MGKLRNVKKLPLILVLVVVAATIWGLYSYHKTQQSAWKRIKNPETVQMLKDFVAIKKAQAYAATNNLPSEVRAMFRYAERGDREALSNSIRQTQTQYHRWEMGNRTGHYGYGDQFLIMLSNIVGDPWYPDEPLCLEGTSGELILEISGAFDSLLSAEEKYSNEFGCSAMKAMPAGSIYFDTSFHNRKFSTLGDSIITMMGAAQFHNKPIFILKEFELQDDWYRDHISLMFAKDLSLHSNAEVQKYLRDNREALFKKVFDYSKEDPVFFHYSADALTKLVFDSNPGHSFFTARFDQTLWMRPYLEPRGFVLEIHRTPIQRLSNETIRCDRDFWGAQVQTKIGGWLSRNTSLIEIAAFAKKRVGFADLTNFSGDPAFIGNGDTQTMFAQSRAAIAALYSWRARISQNPEEKDRLTQEADFAFRQAWALGPYSATVLHPYTKFLMEHDRFSDAMFVARTAASLPQAATDWYILGLPDDLELEHTRR